MRVAIHAAGGYRCAWGMSSESTKRHAWLRALGNDDMPAAINLADGQYVHARTYKHDFFAATGLYEGPSGRMILKIGRVAPLLGLPTAWLGRMLCRRELEIYQHLDALEGVPRCHGSCGPTGFVHAFVEGHPLQRHEFVDDDFFPRLEQLIGTLHGMGMAYVDLEKRENILVDAQGRPALIDFQISWWWPADPALRRRGLRRWLPNVLGRFILARLQKADRYHLLKHQRRHRPDLLSRERMAASHEAGFYIHLDRWVSWPLVAARRTILKVLTGRSRSPKQDGAEFMEPLPPMDSGSAGEQRSGG